MWDRTDIIRRGMEVYLEHGKEEAIRYVYVFSWMHKSNAKCFVEEFCTPTKVKISAYELMDL